MGILAARSVIPTVAPLEADTLLEYLLAARDRLNLPPDDPMCDVVESLLWGPDDAPDDGEPEALLESRRALEAKAREVRKLQRELDCLHRDLEQHEKPPRHSSAPPASPGAPRKVWPAPAMPVASPRAEKPPAPTQVVSPQKSAVPDSELASMRERIDDLKSLLKERHSERNHLRRELAQAKTQIDELRQKPPEATGSAGSAAEVAEESLLSVATFEGKQSVRLPEFARKFQDALPSLPQHIARSCLGLVGRLAGGDASAFAAVKRLKSLPGVYRARLSDDYRLLFRLSPARIEILDLIHRRDLERKIKAMM